ncbi:XRE family transcriptional regulator [Sporolactobacillus shoreae]|uniref:XRE family transcriptional regulator n=1 Tax=Sporolactobacillus shoreae TaxID=1465501 RepID=A0A4Z0GMX5_9BACL|nr:helix-turn-helix transcriptional regulator [Sporolactobacillus shoreae]TGA97132.1 XRE family transcriptional regulator [Sporolactobacillus shoreae]
MNFHEKMQSLRKKQGMSQEKLAEIVGVSRQAVSKWESGQSDPDKDKLIVFSDLFGVSTDKLIRDELSIEVERHQENDPGTYYDAWRYEFKSKRTLFGLPLVHINLGPGFCVAKGILAIGTVSIGALSIGGISLGGLCLGGLSAGFLGFGGIVLGLILAVGGLSIGALAIGGLAIGVLSLGGLSVGVFSIGGTAIASHVAIGGYAEGHIAIGQSPHGVIRIVTHTKDLSDLTSVQVRKLILKEYPGLWKPMIDWLTFFFR